MLKIAVIGYGYWGPNIARNFNATDGAEVIAICDENPDALKDARRRYPNAGFSTDYMDVISSKDTDALAIITPVRTHYPIAREALGRGKHVFIEKPFTCTSREAEELLETADRNGLKIMVDHTFLFTGAVREIERLIKDNVIGDIYYYDSTRVNLGLFQHDINVIWDLATHDLSVMDHLITDRPQAISANGMDHFATGMENVAYITVYYADKIAHFNVNWLSPVKIRRTCICGKNKMLVWDDLEPDEKLKIYNKGIDVKSKEGIYNLMVEYRSGDMRAPVIDRTEALKLVTEHFVDCVLHDREPISGGRAGLRVVKMLEAANESLRGGGVKVKL